MEDRELEKLLDEAEMEYKNGITAFYRLSDILAKIRREK